MLLMAWLFSVGVAAWAQATDVHKIAADFKARADARVGESGADDQ